MSKDKRRSRGFRLLVIPHGSGSTRTFEVGSFVARFLPLGLALFSVLLLLLLGSWVYLASRASRVDDLEARLAEMEGQQESLERLALRLEEAEARYERLRLLFGPDSARSASEVWLPAVDAGESSRDEPDEEGDAPSSWPLTERGFVTQTLLSGDGGEHQGLDIAVPSHSYIRAAGGGEVVEVGEDSIYGRYVILDHGGGYRSVYGHAAETLVTAGQEVRVNEVIALSGSTGRSTAPHLHFEILLDGEPLDPLTLVEQP
ncbi:MAG: M23 family metallopeptidase [Longimicrobiales bacterium]|nr:M23 family metallopeptidase [Longimicrobiales bacterium]